MPNNINGQRHRILIRIEALALRSQLLQIRPEHIEFFHHRRNVRLDVRRREARAEDTAPRLPQSPVRSDEIDTVSEGTKLIRHLQMFGKRRVLAELGQQVRVVDDHHLVGDRPHVQIEVAILGVLWIFNGDHIRDESSGEVLWMLHGHFGGDQEMTEQEVVR
jgi:hypothetical protein